ncbi:hypothetical protein F5Y10DRAFT_246953 [Nemania abortiva]|nr:hypothetical protein F5Y10DRAFT_246953 [Nemania abortiva]
MNQTQDVSRVADIGHTTIAASMTTWAFLVLIAWGLIGYQLHRERKRRLADLENGTPVGLVDGDVPLEDVLKGPNGSGTHSVRVTESSFGSWSRTQQAATRESQGESQGSSGAPRARSLFRRMVSNIRYRFEG